MAVGPAAHATRFELLRPMPGRRTLPHCHELLRVVSNNQLRMTKAGGRGSLLFSTRNPVSRRLGVGREDLHDGSPVEQDVAVLLPLAPAAEGQVVILIRLAGAEKQVVVHAL